MKRLWAGAVAVVSVTATAWAVATVGGGAATSGAPAPAHVVQKKAAAEQPARRPASVPGANGAPREAAFGAGQRLVYGLTGRANANTVPAEGLTPDNFLVVHPETELTFTSLPGDEFPPLLGDPSLGRVVSTTVNGARARLQLTANGYGTQRLEWLADGNVYTLLCDRLTTSDGVSGLTVAQLLDIARSVS